MSSPPTLPRFAFLTPRTLPPAEKLEGRVAVLDIAFASEGGGASFDEDDAAVHPGARRAGWPPGWTTTITSDTPTTSGTRASCLRRRPSTARAPSWSRPRWSRGAGRSTRWRCTWISTGSTRARSGCSAASSPTRAPTTTRARSTRGAASRGRSRADRSRPARALSRRDAQAPGHAVPGRAHQGARAVGGDRRGRARDRSRCSTRAAASRSGYELRDGVAYVEAGSRPVRQDRAAAARAGAGAGGGGPGLGLADHRRRLRVGLRLREDVRPRRRHADARDGAGRAPRRGDGQARGRGRARAGAAV